MIRQKIWKGFEFKDGKGFSIRELKSAGLSLSEARRLDIAIDTMRRSKYEGNVTLLSDVKSKAPPKPAKKLAPRKVAQLKKPTKKPVKKPLKKATEEKKKPSKNYLDC